MIRHPFAAIAAAACLTLLTGCSTGLPAQNSGTYQIVCTNFPEYDWTMHIVSLSGMEDAFEVTYLLDNGVDIHNYQPTAADMAKIAGCDLFIYVGGESEHWVEDALAEAVNPDMRTVRLFDVIHALEEETVEGMEAEEEEDEAEEPELDEHVWLSVRNAELCCEAITEQVQAIDAPHQAIYSDNLYLYKNELLGLDEGFTRIAEQTGHPTLIVADRFPFRYFVEDYGYEYYAAFAGCSAETEASFETIAFLAQKADEIGAGTIFTIEGGNTDIAEAVIANTRTKDQKTAKLNSLQSVTAEQIAEGATYVSLMSENLEVLREASGQ